MLLSKLKPEYDQFNLAYSIDSRIHIQEKSEFHPNHLSEYRFFMQRKSLNDVLLKITEEYFYFSKTFLFSNTIWVKAIAFYSTPKFSSRFNWWATSSHPLVSLYAPHNVCAGRCWLMIKWVSQVFSFYI